MAIRSSKNKKIRLVAIAAALSTGGIVIALLPSANADVKVPQDSVGAAGANRCQQHHFEVIGSPELRENWSVFGDLRDGKGEKVYHWEETDKSPGESLLWRFNYCGDNGKGHIWIDATPNDRHPKLNLKLDRDYCWKIIQPTLLSTNVVSC